MSTTHSTGAPIRSTLDEDAKQAVASRLQPLLGDLIELSLTGKQLHWNVVGRTFRSLHLQLDEVVVEYRTWSDQVAERLTSLGIAPDGRVQRVAEDSPDAAAPEGFVDVGTTLEVMASRVEAVARRTRERLDGLGDVDLASEGIVVAILEGLEMQLWMLSAQEQ